MIAQKTNNIQQILSNVFKIIPMILHNNRSKLYILISNLADDLERFIRTGESSTNSYRLISIERELEMVRQWRLLGLSVTYYNHQIEYMHHRVAITCLHVCDPTTGMAVKLIPWFLLPGRPYPIFLYFYVIWHYNTSGRKSLSQSAAAAGKLFGISRLNKSTVSRTIKAMDNFIDIAQGGEALAIDEREMLHDDDIIESVVKILGNVASIELLEESNRYSIKQLPAPLPRKEAICKIFSNIPDEYSQATKENTPARGNIRDARRRPARPRNKDFKCVQRQPDFVDSLQIRKIRTGLINICRCIVLDAAIKYHRFLI